MTILNSIFRSEVPSAEITRYRVINSVLTVLAALAVCITMSFASAAAVTAQPTELTNAARAIREDVSQESCPYRALLARRQDILAMASAIATTESQQSDRQDAASALFDLISHEQEIESVVLSMLERSRHPDIRTIAGERSRFMKRTRQTAAFCKVTSFDGDMISIEALRPKIVVIATWNLYCSACRLAMPKLQAAFEKYKDDIVIVGVCSLYKREGQECRALLAEKGITYPNGVLPTEELKTAMAYFRPYASVGGQYFLLSRDGRLVTTNISGNWLNCELQRAVSGQLCGEAKAKSGANASTPE